MKKFLLAIGALAAIILFGFATLYYAMFRPVASFDFAHPPQIIKAHFMPLDRVQSISKFRSGAGHDFSDETSPCSSMKHYFQPPFDPNQYSYRNGNNGLPPPPNGINDIPIFSPIDGKIIGISEEHTPIGKQITIQSDIPGMQIRLFHVWIDTLKRGQRVRAGDKLGVIGAMQGTDIAIQVNVLNQQRFLSYFEVMPDSLFSDYAKYGITSRNQVIISEQFRNSHPLVCRGEEFAQKSNFDSEDYVKLQSSQ